jgi:amino acid permease
VQGNVLLDFDENDPLLMVGRMCLAVTITLAFPLLVIPARDILLRSLIIPCLVKTNQGTNNSDVSSSNVEASAADQLQEPLLGGDHGLNTTLESNVDTATRTAPLQASFLLRLITAIGILWTSAAVASCVESIDIVWDLLGSSLSILLSYLIPSGCYLAVTRNNNPDTTTSGSLPRSASRFLAWCLILLFTPLMFLSTGNAIANTFFA